MSQESRSARLAVLRDRASRGSLSSDDVQELLTLAAAAERELEEARSKLTEAESWRALIVENTSVLKQALNHGDRIEELMEPMAAAALAKARFFDALATPKVLLPLGMLAMLLTAAFVGAVTIKPVDLGALVVPGIAAPSSPSPLPVVEPSGGEP